MFRSATRLLLVIYGLSVISNSFLDAGHEMFHYFKSTIHHHEHHKHHHIRDHHVLPENHVDTQDRDSEINLTLLGYLVFFEDRNVYDLPLSMEIKFQPRTIIARAHSGYTTPPLTPPLL